MQEKQGQRDIKFRGRRMDDAQAAPPRGFVTMHVFNLGELTVVGNIHESVESLL